LTGILERKTELMATTKKPVTKKTATKKVVDTASGAVKLPVSFNQFRKYPIAAVAFLCVFGIIYVYKDMKAGSSKGIDNCIEDNRNLQKTVDKKDSIIYNIIAQQAIINATK
jgi:hypothetical protein